jgi:hypothetical protein
VKWYGKFGRKVRWIVKKKWKIQKKIVKKYEKYGRKASWIVKRYGKYRKKLWKDMEIMKERSVE